MLTNYDIEDRADQLCALFHGALTDAELLTGVPELKLGNFTIKPMATSANRYMIFHNGTFVMCVRDEPGHTFTVSVPSDSFMTVNMCTVVLDCLMATYEKLGVPQPSSPTKDKAIELVTDIIRDCDGLSVDEISDLSELVYGEENQRQLESFND